MQTEEQKSFFCSGCEEECIYSHEREKHENPDNKEQFLCDDCFYANWDYCADCGEVEHRDDMSWINDDVICSGCYSENYFYCERCDRNYHNDDYGGDNLCNECYSGSDDEDTGHINRKYDTSNKYVEEGKRAYSAEIECYYNDISDLEVLKDNIADEIGISDDGSLSGCGKEFQTPKLSGDTGDKVMKTLCAELVKNEFYVDKSCGLHIHLDTSDMAGNAELIKKVWLFYMAFEPVIFSYLPLSRRKNRFCMPLSEFYHEKEILNCYTIEDLEKIWYREQVQENIDSRKCDKYDSTRYAGINLHSLLSNGHIEIRYHSGTIDYKKIKMWADLHIAILDAIKDIKLSELVEIKYALQLNEKQEKFFAMLNLSEDIKKYFISRQNKFGTIKSEQKNICAE